ncbi:monocarboxylate transporter 3-like [Paramacrobiotus metropolitanus]|uniref:monocarboxylate transporter 3-like n=1 Tax=Paramacrobiotus metropolitanus TaxID=2943436 RepID=UPI00244583A8|nr:monocarboxylate transporter 3-like [Paramacrobiotus metropolitanus]
MTRTAKYHVQPVGNGNQGYFDKGGDQVDRGYAWAICATAGLIYTITDGVSFSTGVLFPEFMSYYSSPANEAAWISSLMFGAMLLSGPLIGVLISRFGARVVGFVGSLLAAGGMVASFWAPNVYYLMGTLGVLTGLGYGCIMLAALTSVTFWFDAKRGFAFGLAVVISGLGTFVISLLTAFLLDHYGLHGALLILAGVSLQGCILALLLRPAPKHLPEPLSHYPKKHFDPAMFKRVKFDIFLLACLIFATGYFPIFMFVTSWAEQVLQLNAVDAAAFLTIIAVAQLAGRMVCAVLIDRTWVNKSFLLAGALWCGGAAACLSLYCTTYKTAVMFCCVYGFGGGCAMVGLPMLTPLLVTKEQTEVASGFFVFAFGVSALLGLPAAGAVVEYLQGDFRWLMVGSGGLICAGSFVVAAIECH